MIYVNLKRLKFFETEHTTSELAEFRSCDYSCALRIIYRLKDFGLIAVSRKDSNGKKGRPTLFYKITEYGKKFLELFEDKIDFQWDSMEMDVTGHEYFNDAEETLDKNNYIAQKRKIAIDENSGEEYVVYESRGKHDDK